GNTYRGSTSPWRSPSPAPLITLPSAFRHDQAEVPVAAPVDDRDPLVGRVPEYQEVLAGGLQSQARLLDAHRLGRLALLPAAHDPLAGPGPGGRSGGLFGSRLGP